MKKSHHKAPSAAVAAYRGELARASTKLAEEYRLMERMKSVARQYRERAARYEANARSLIAQARVEYNLAVALATDRRDAAEKGTKK